MEFIDGTTEQITANIIAENIMSQVDAEGNRQLLLKEIVDHKYEAPEGSVHGDNK